MPRARARNAFRHPRPSVRRPVFFLLFLSLIAFGASCREDATEVSSSIIDGVWETACLNANSQSSERITYTFLANNSVTRVVNFYSDTQCESLRAELTHKGIFALAVREDESTYEIDMVIREALAQPKTSEGAKLWNDSLFCGLSRWLERKDENVMAQTDERCSVYGLSSIEYRDVLSLSADRVLSFGGELNHGVPRPLAVDAQNPRKVFLFKAP